MTTSELKSARALRSLPLQVKPLPGEPFDSWSLAYAHRLGASIGDFLHGLGLLPDPRYTLNYTIALHDDEAKRVAALTGLTSDELRATTLRPFAGRMIVLQDTRRAVMRSVWWGRGAGSRYCPQCLSERDGRWLLRWRLSWVFACTRHRSLLHDHCPRCGRVPRQNTMRPGCEQPPARCSRNPAPRTVCNEDLSKVESLPLRHDDPILAAQHQLDPVIDAIESGRTDTLEAAQSDIWTDLRAVGGWMLRQGEAGDFDEFGSKATQAWHEAHTRYTSESVRPSQFPPTDAALMGALVARAHAVINSDDLDAAVIQVRELLLRSTRRVTVRPPGLEQQWQRLTDRTRALFIRASDPDRGPIDRLRLRSCTPHARLAIADDSTVTARAPHLPQMLWPGWTIRLMPANGFHTDPFRAVLSLCLLIPGDGRKPVDLIAKHLHPHIGRGFVSITLQQLTNQGHHTLVTALCELAENLDLHGSLIDYARRRRVITPDLLDDNTWRTICRDTRSHPGQDRRLLDTRRYLVQNLTGNDMNDPAHPLRFRSANDRNVFSAFVTSLTTPLRHALHQHAAQHLHDLGVDEPVSWEPPRDWAPSLIPPGREPDDIDTDLLRRMVIDDGTLLGDAARLLDTSIDHIRLALEGIDRVDTRTGIAKPAQAWDVRQRARTLLTAAFLEREYIQKGKRLQQIADETGFTRPVVAEIAKELGYTLTPGQRRKVVDEQWLREQYIIKRRSFPDIATQCGVSEMTVTRYARQYGIPSRPQGVVSHPHMVTKLDSTIHRDIRRAVEGGLHGWQRLRRFLAITTFPTVDDAANHLSVDQSTLVRQIQRLEQDIGAPLFTRATRAQPMRLTRRGTALLRALETPQVQRYLTTAPAQGTKATDQKPRKADRMDVIEYRGTSRKTARK